MSAAWPLVCVMAWVAAGVAGLVATSALFSPEAIAERPRAELPILAFAIAYAMVGAGFLAAMPAIQRASALPPAQIRRLLIAGIGAGLVFRIALFASAPVLEVDFNRYLWDGALSARGFNPYAIAPAEVGRLAYDDPWLELSKMAAPIFERISYPDLKTIYPPVAQAAFALAHVISPFELWAWRLVCLALEGATLALLLGLLAAVGRSPLWGLLYWLNPLVLKEIANSAHMEAVLSPLVLGALLAGVQGRPFVANGLLALAIGVKLWPVLLLPLTLRPLVGSSRRLVAAIAMVAGLIGAMALPILLGGVDRTSGFVGFADHWATASVLFPVFRGAIEAAFGAAGNGLDAQTSLSPGRIARLVAAGLVVGLSVALARRTIDDAGDLLRRAYLVVSALVLLSPVQFPWYMIWVLPLAAVVGGIGWQVAAATTPLYYTAFHLRDAGAAATFDMGVVWLIWVPVWVALALDARAARTSAASRRGAKP